MTGAINADLSSSYLHINSSSSILKILLVEDLMTDAELIKMHLKKLNIEYVVEHAKNQVEFEKKFADFKPQFVLSDYSLPQLTGMEVLQMVKALNKYIPVIICTGSINEETAVNCIKEGAEDYVLKESMGRLASAVMNALEKSNNLIEKERTVIQLEQSEEKFRTIANNAPANIYRLSDNGVIEYVNNDILGNDRHELIGETIYSVTDKNAGLYIKDQIARLVKGEEIDGFIVEETILGNTRWFDCRLSLLKEESGNMGIIFITSDISRRIKASIELKESHQKLSDLTRHLENIRDEEKKKIAMEIHDQLGQELTGNKLGLYWIQQQLKEKESIDKAGITDIFDKTEYLVDLTTQTINTVRRIAHELRPVVLDDIGLIPALEWHVNNYNSNHEVQCELIIGEINIECDKELSTSIYRIMQEALTNINRHANASNAYIRFYSTEKSLKLEIEDNGVGINLDKAMKSKSLGLFGIKERIKKWSGIIDISGERGKGTLIVIEIPFKGINETVTDAQNSYM